MIEKATFGAGCFWRVEEEFRKIKGVIKTAVGYMGGKIENPSYEEVCTNETDHIEVCQVEFNPDIVSYEQLLKVFWKVHNPTQYNQQGPDVGSQYNSVIFFYTLSQKTLALKSKEREQKNYSGQIVTEILPAKMFYEAEAYHQKYLMKRGKNTC